MPSIKDAVQQNAARIAAGQQIIENTPGGAYQEGPFVAPAVSPVTGLPIRGTYPPSITLHTDFQNNTQGFRTGPNMRSAMFPNPTSPSNTNIKVTTASGNSGGTIASSLLLETNNMANASQKLLNLLNGTNISIVSDSMGNVTISTVDPSFQSLITSVALTNQTASIAGTNLISTPVVTGLYYISYYLSTTTAGSAGTALFTVTWNDGAAQTVNTSTIDLSSLGSYVSGVLIVKGTSGAIQYATTVTGAMSSPQYNLDIRVVPLG